VQWVFYKRKNSPNYLVKILLNEAEVHINGLKSTGYHYKWSDLRAFYVSKLSRLHVGLADDMGAYLNGLK
jgi:multiple inositol-polyphosphate phosphatase/2,3-bisphosphoglycerate 3-phosphatase